MSTETIETEADILTGEFPHPDEDAEIDSMLDANAEEDEIAPDDGE
jgi:hypothetical protein